MATKETKSVLVNFPLKLLEDIEAYADEMNVNRTSAILFLLTQSLNNQKAMNNLNEVVRLAKKDT